MASTCPASRQRTLELTGVVGASVELRENDQEALLEEAAAHAEQVGASKATPLKFVSSEPVEDSTRDSITKGGLAELVVLLAIVFATSSPRIFVTPLWTFSWYIPIVSPVYGQGHVWMRESRSKYAILLHVVSGTIMLFCAAAQFDKKFRHGHRTIHRWVGRLYVISGLVCILSLQVLRSHVGQGHGDGPTRAMQLGIDAATVIWLFSTGRGIAAAVWGDYEKHRQMMTLSFCVAISPIIQRMLIWIPLAPMFMLGRLALDAFYRVPFWHSRWPSNVASWASWAPPPDNTSGHRGPHVLTFSGYGVAEQMSFSISSWSGLAASLAIAYVLQQSSGLYNMNGLHFIRDVGKGYSQFISEFGKLFHERGVDLRIALPSSAYVPSFIWDGIFSDLAPHSGSEKTSPPPVWKRLMLIIVLWSAISMSAPSLALGIVLAVLAFELTYLYFILLVEVIICILISAVIYAASVSFGSGG